MTLPGLELFFQHANCIMPWHGGPDSFRVLSTPPAPTGHVNGRNGSICMERSPDDKMPLNWKVMRHAKSSWSDHPGSATIVGCWLLVQIWGIFGAETVSRDGVRLNLHAQAISICDNSTFIT